MCRNVSAESEVQKSECTKECAEKQVQSDVLEGDVLRKCSAREGILPVGSHACVPTGQRADPSGERHVRALPSKKKVQ